MADPADITAERMEREDEARLAHRKPSGPKYTGLCAWCEEQVAHPLRWCNADCRDQFDKREARR